MTIKNGNIIIKDMKVVYNDTIPFQGYMAMTIYPFIFVRSVYKRQFNDVAKNHEEIHGKQQTELLIVPFFVLYVLLWIVELFVCAFNKKRGQNERGTLSWSSRAYRSIAFEAEAYAREKDLTYLNARKHFAWVKYIINK